MEKAKVIMALEKCSGERCAGCPYELISNCTSKLSEDAIAMLKANETTKASVKYTCAIIFTKRTNLSAYANNKVYERCGSDAQFEAMRKRYAQEMEVQLILLTRWEGKKMMCRIKCPINPLPVKGEFEVPSYYVIDRYLRNNGWQFKQKFFPQMFD